MVSFMTLQNSMDERKLCVCVCVCVCLCVKWNGWGSGCLFSVPGSEEGRGTERETERERERETFKHL